MNFSKAILLVICMLSYRAAEAKWNLLVYFDPCEEITLGAIKNITDLARGYTSEDVQIYLQFRHFISLDYRRPYTWRYEIKDNSLHYVESIDMTDDYIHDITDAAAWAFKNAEPDDINGILFCGHGYGVLDPKPEEFMSPSVQVMDWVLEDDDAYDFCGCLKHNVERMRMKSNKDRANVMNPLGTEKYLSNEEMVVVFDQISQMLGKKLDILGLDLCLAASIEHAYQMAPYVKYLISCENCQWPDNWNYYAIAKWIDENRNGTLQEFFDDFVEKYGDYYATNQSHRKYQTSVIDCEASELVAEALGDVARDMMSMMDRYPEFCDLLLQARQEALHLGFVPMYTDLYQVLGLIWQHAVAADFLEKEDRDRLIEKLHLARELTRESIKANVASPLINQAHGMNIYFPHTYIEESYERLPFAINSGWLEFLYMFTKCVPVFCECDLLPFADYSQDMGEEWLAEPEEFFGADVE